MALMIEVFNKTFSLSTGRYTVIGNKNTTNNVVHISIDHADVNTKHAVISKQTDAMKIMDLLSSTGTYVNGFRMEPLQWQTIEDDSILQFGNVEAKIIKDVSNNNSSGFLDMSLTNSSKKTDTALSCLQRLSASADTSGNSFSIPETQVFQARNSSVGGKDDSGNSFTIPETQYIPARTSAGGVEDSFIPETQELLINNFDEQIDADLLEAENDAANIEKIAEDLECSEFHISTQDFNESIEDLFNASCGVLDDFVVAEDMPNPDAFLLPNAKTEDAKDEEFDMQPTQLLEDPATIAAAENETICSFSNSREQITSNNTTLNITLDTPALPHNILENMDAINDVTISNQLHKSTPNLSLNNEQLSKQSINNSKDVSATDDMQATQIFEIKSGKRLSKDMEEVVENAACISQNQADLVVDDMLALTQPLAQSHSAADEILPLTPTLAHSTTVYTTVSVEFPLIEDSPINDAFLDIVDLEATQKFVPKNTASKEQETLISTPSEKENNVPSSLNLNITDELQRTQVFQYKSVALSADKELRKQASDEQLDDLPATQPFFISKKEKKLKRPFPETLAKVDIKEELNKSCAKENLDMASDNAAIKVKKSRKAENEASKTKVIMDEKAAKQLDVITVDASVKARKKSSKKDSTKTEIAVKEQKQLHSNVETVDAALKIKKDKLQIAEKSKDKSSNEIVEKTTRNTRKVSSNVKNEVKVASTETHEDVRGGTRALRSRLKSEDVAIETKPEKTKFKKITKKDDVIIEQDQQVKTKKTRAKRQEKAESENEKEKQKEKEARIKTIKEQQDKDNARDISTKPLSVRIKRERISSGSSACYKEKPTAVAVAAAENTLQTISAIKKEPTSPQKTTTQPTKFVEKNRNSHIFKICTTLVDSAKLQDLQSKAAGLWIITGEPMEADVLIMDQPMRTFKFMVAIARGIPIVNSEWLEHISASKSVANSEKYLVKYPKFEKQYKFSLLKSLERAQAHKIFANYDFLMTPNIEPNPQQIQVLVECAGGTMHKTTPKYSHQGRKLYLISLPKDNKYWHSHRRINEELRIISTEGIMTAVVQQNVEALDKKLLA